ncbi:hypothetical protein ABID08_002046 [Rhizobium binae]|uniref:DUF2971 domain-containing protein n=1 Tax=Rhizobium binae TaxID=1138190 RepID=A0ABV2MDY6_9HYPH|nr:DUF2971 domain-containing protein [Rhizobium binae]MBX4992876.1 DUF2971 domain-containing protein [Rhizobium binae]NKL49422.1 DUF2971 domain-containing protein [Rhizobium leguminosarum bv. viciae]QSY84183.1 DUF2971 domain-containing protein [Rhizobium binae]
MIDFESDPLKPEQYNGNPEILYHYCSTATFHAIISNATIRLSALRLSNDSMEGEWYDSKLKDAIQAQNAQEFLPRWYYSQRDFINQAAILGLCLSEQCDLLSQWRGYADDGRGFCIGFRGEKLMQLAKMGGRAIKVIYDEGEQERIVTQIVEKQRQRKPTDISLEATKNFAFAFKNPGFEEEREWRIVHEAGYEKCNYVAKGTHLAPYLDISIPEEQRQELIAKIIIGPANNTPVEMVRGFMLHHLFGSSMYEIRPSRSSYRVRS